MGNKRALAFAAIIFTVAVWGISFLSIKEVVSVLPPMTLSFLRFVMATIILFVIFRLREPDTKLRKKDLPLMVLSGLLGITIYFYFENNGVKLTTASAASIIIATIPIFTVITDSILFGYKLNGLKITGVVLSVIGVYFVVGADVSDMSGTLGGFLFMLGAVVSWIIYNFVTRPLAKKYSELAIAFYQSFFGTLALFPFIFLEKTNWSLISKPIIMNLVFLGIFCSAIANYFYVFSMENLGVSLTSQFMNLVPLVTVLTSFVALKQEISLMQVTGGIIVIVSVYFVSYKKRDTLKDGIEIQVTESSY